MVCAVTGGGRGIGRAIAAAYAAAGARVAVCGRSPEELDEARRHVGAIDGAAPLHTATCDVSDEADVNDWAAAVREALGDPAVVVNNAGVVARGRLDEQDVAEWRRVIDVNLVGSMLVTRAFLPAMRRARAGRVINVASISGRLGTPRLTAYCASKHAVIGLTRALAEEVRDDGVQVMAICPGSVDTKMLEGSGFPPDMTADDIARVALFLATSAPDAMTGSCVDVLG